jgi:hypothetical protein
MGRMFLNERRMGVFDCNIRAYPGRIYVDSAYAGISHQGGSIENQEFVAYQAVAEQRR